MAEGEEPRAHQNLEAVANPRLLDQIERWDRSARPFEVKIRTYFREPRLLLERGGWRYKGHFEITEREFSGELTHDLMQRMPQAKLRDLFRPVMELGWHERESLVDPPDTAGLRAMADAKAAQQRQPVETLASLLAVVKQEQAKRRAWLAERWQPFLKDDEPRRELVPWGGSSKLDLADE